MLSADHADREPSVLVGVLGLASFLLIYFALSHIPWAWERWSGWLLGFWAAPVTLPSNPYTLSGNWMQ